MSNISVSSLVVNTSQKSTAGGIDEHASLPLSHRLPERTFIRSVSERMRNSKDSYRVTHTSEVSSESTTHASQLQPSNGEMLSVYLGEFRRSERPINEILVAGK